jgi:hypothetical protein
MKICVLSDYQVHGNFIIGILPVLKVYDASTEKNIHTRFQKICDEKSLLKFAKNMDFRH